MSQLNIMSRLDNKIVGYIFSAIICFSVLAYPMLMSSGMVHFSAAQFACFILVVFTVRFLIMKNARQWFVYLGVVVFCSSVIYFNNDSLLHYYPVFMSGGFAALFFLSLRSDVSLIEQFVRASGKIPPDHALNYLRGLSLAWGVFLLANGSVAAYTACCTSPFFWGLYNGVLSYAAMAIFVAVELMYRRYYKQKNGFTDD